MPRLVSKAITNIFIFLFLFYRLLTQNWWEKKLEWNTICKKSDINSYLISKYSVVLLYLCFLKGFVKRVQITKSSVKGNLLTFIFYISFYLHLIKYGGFEVSYIGTAINDSQNLQSQWDDFRIVYNTYLDLSNRKWFIITIDIMKIGMCSIYIHVPMIMVK